MAAAPVGTDCRESLTLRLGATVHAWRDNCWRPMLLDGRALAGFHWQPLADTGQWSAYWMKVEAGAQSPLHEHPATELLHIHEGVLLDEDGRAYGAGDVVVYAAASRHFTRSPTGCHALVVTSRAATVPS